MRLYNVKTLLTHQKAAISFKITLIKFIKQKEFVLQICVK